MAEYHSFISKYLNLSSFNYVSCSDANCTNGLIKLKSINYTHIVTCDLTSALSHYWQVSGYTGQFIKKSVPGWNDFVLDAKTASSDAYTLWCMVHAPHFNHYV